MGRGLVFGDSVFVVRDFLSLEGFAYFTRRSGRPKQHKQVAYGLDFLCALALLDELSDRFSETFLIIGGNLNLDQLVAAKCLVQRLENRLAKALFSNHDNGAKVVGFAPKKRSLFRRKCHIGILKSVQKKNMRERRLLPRPRLSANKGHRVIVKCANLLILLVVSCLSGGSYGSDVKVLTWKKLKTYPHDPQAYTQGLVYWEPGILAESTGQYGESTIRRVELATGKVLSQAKLDRKYFGEGLAKWKDLFIQLTWREGTALKWIWSKKSGWEPKGEFRYEGEGWGLAAAADGTLYMSNGTDKLVARNSKSFAQTNILHAKAGKLSQDLLNELEVVGDHVFANRWQTSLIVRIKIKTGEVDGIMDIKDLVPIGLKASPLDAVANGIAWDPAKKVFYITGKMWPSLYEIKVEGY